jgi:hypothetical protein
MKTCCAPEDSQVAAIPFCGKVDGRKVSRVLYFSPLPKGDVSALGWFDEKWMGALGSLSINGMQLRFGNSSVHGPSPACGGTPSAPDAAYP